MNFRKLYKDFKGFLNELKQEEYYPDLFYKFEELIEDHDKYLRDMDFYHGRIMELVHDFIDNNGYLPFSSGAFRKTIIIDDDFVLKVAVKKEALKQNEQEVYIGRDSKYSKWFPKVYEAHPRFIWLLVEKVKPLSYYDKDILFPYPDVFHGSDLRFLLWGYAEIQKYGKESFYQKVFEKFRYEYGPSGAPKPQDDSWGFSNFVGVFNKYYFKRAPIRQQMAEHKNLFFEVLEKWYGEFGAVVEKNEVAKQFVQLAMELPNIEIWDFRTDNLGWREDVPTSSAGVVKNLVILDSSFLIQS